MTHGIITFTTKKYYELSNKFIESVLNFSTYPVTLYTIGFEVTEKKDRVDYVMIEKNAYFDNWQTKCFYKHLICSLTPYDISIYLDTDIIITPDFQEFFTLNENRIKSSNTIFGTKHPHEPSTNPTTATRPYINAFFNTFGVLEVPGYVFACAYAFNRNMITHFQKMFEKDIMLVKNNIIPLTGDEAVLNLYLYKKNLINGTDCGFDFCPHYSEGFFESFINNSWKTCKKYINDYKAYNREVLPILFHGNKDLEYADRMIREIKKKYKK